MKGEAITGTLVKFFFLKNDIRTLKGSELKTKGLGMKNENAIFQWF